MRILSLFMISLLLLAAGCTTTASSEKPKIHCPACGTDLDAVMHKHF
jgi:ssDNA-binding Zn-finger/Zn-ribbon topoisomerase 1